MSRYGLPLSSQNCPLISSRVSIPSITCRTQKRKKRVITNDHCKTVCVLALHHLRGRKKRGEPSQKTLAPRRNAHRRVCVLGLQHLRGRKKRSEPSQKTIARRGNAHRRGVWTSSTYRGVDTQHQHTETLSKGCVGPPAPRGKNKMSESSQKTTATHGNAHRRVRFGPPSTHRGEERKKSWSQERDHGNTWKRSQKGVSAFHLLVFASLGRKNNASHRGPLRHAETLTEGCFGPSIYTAVAASRVQARTQVASMLDEGTCGIHHKK